MSNQTIVAEVVSLSSVTVEAIDHDIRESISNVGVFVTVERAARAYALGADRFYRVILAAGAHQGVYRLPANDKGCFPSSDSTVKQILGHVSENTTSARKYASEILNLAWQVTAAGLDPFGFACVADLRKACKPAKESESKPEQDQTSTVAQDAAKAAEEAEEAAKAARIEAEAAEAARMVEEAARIESEVSARVRRAMLTESAKRARTAQKLRALRAQIKALQVALASASAAPKAKRAKVA